MWVYFYENLSVSISICKSFYHIQRCLPCKNKQSILKINRLRKIYTLPLWPKYISPHDVEYISMILNYLWFILFYTCTHIYICYEWTLNSINTLFLSLPPSRQHPHVNDERIQINFKFNRFSWYLHSDMSN